MNIMKRKIFGLLVVTLLLAMILPIAASASESETEQQNVVGKKRTFVSGFILFPPRPAFGGMYMYFFAVSLRAGQIGGDYHIFRMQPVFVKATYGFHGFALPGYIMGWFDGPIGLAG